MKLKTIGLIAPGSPVAAGAIELSIKALQKLGCEAKSRGGTYSTDYIETGVPFNDAERAGEIMLMFKDPNVQGIMALRGGYGCGRILDMLDYDFIAANKKPIFGYSDITALHIALNQKAGLRTYHTPMPATELINAVDEYTLFYLLRCLREDNPFGKIENPRGIALKTLKGGKCSGILTGGNLCLITSLLGTPYEIETRNKIIFLEDVDEQPYKIDRMLLQLRLAGKFDNCAGVLLGSFTNSALSVSASPAAVYSESNNQLYEIFTNHFLRCNKPVIYNFSCGHIMPTASLPLGRFMHMNADDRILEVY